MRKDLSIQDLICRYAGLGLALSVILICGCTTKAPPYSPETTKKKYFSKTPTTIEQSIITKLERSYRVWMDTPYRYGGMSRKGVDCSGLSIIMYKEVFGRTLPRTTHAQLSTGSKVEKKNLNPGDLLFFKINGRISHVGIYLFNGVFIHASTSKGVIKSNLANPYWSAHYHSSRTHWS